MAPDYRVLPARARSTRPRSIGCVHYAAPGRTTQPFKHACSEVLLRVLVCTRVIMAQPSRPADLRREPALKRSGPSRDTARPQRRIGEPFSLSNRQLKVSVSPTPAQLMLNRTEGRGQAQATSHARHRPLSSSTLGVLWLSTRRRPPPAVADASAREGSSEPTGYILQHDQRLGRGREICC